MRILVFLFGFLDAFDLFNSRELCGQYGVHHPKDLWSIDMPPFVFFFALLAVVGAFGVLFYLLGRARNFW